MEEHIYNKLLQLNTLEDHRFLNSQATIFGINKCLKIIYGENIHIISSSKFSKDFIRTDKGAKEFCSEVLNILKENQGILKKPIVSFFSFNDIKRDDDIENHWQILVILPIEDNKWKMLFKDSCFSNQTLWLEIKKILAEVVDKKSIEVELFDGALQNIIQKKNRNDCGWWCLYNIIMFIKERSIDFFYKIPYESDKLGKILREIFYKENLIFEEESCLENKEEIITEVLNENKRKILKNPRKMRISFGVSNFKQSVLQSYYIIDKSLFIRDVLNSEQKILIITRPRDWGKTLNLDMLRAFLEIEKDRNDLENKRKLFEGGEYKISRTESKLLNELKIAKDKNMPYYKQNIGKYPVIFIRFSSHDIDIDLDPDKAFKEVVDEFRNSIRDSYDDHENLYKAKLEKARLKLNLSTTLRNNIDKPLSKKWTLFKEFMIRENNADLSKSIKNLINVLYKSYKKKVVILIDEFDSYIYNAIQHPLFEKIMILYNSILQPLKDNNKIERVVMTGILPIGLSYVLSGLNVYSVFTIRDLPFTEHFGFTPDEIDHLLEVIPENHNYRNRMQKKDIDKRYHGYKCLNKTIYHPLLTIISIEGYLEGDHQILSGYIGVLRVFDDILLKDKNIEVIIELIYKRKIKYMLSMEMSHALNTVNDLLLLLVHTGYLTSCKEPNYYKIPNKWVHSYFIYTYKSRILDKISAGNEILESVYRNFSCVIENLGKFKENIEKLLNQKDFIDKNESNFKNCLDKIAKLSRVYKYCYSKIVPDYKSIRPNNILIPHDEKSQLAIIHEVKQTQHKIRVKSLLETAIWEIYSQLSLDYIISLIQNDKKFSYIQIIKTRVIVFYEDSHKNWKVEIIERSHSIFEAIKINNFFKTCGDRSLLISKLSTTRRISRKELLKTMNADDLSACLDKLANE